MSKLITEFDNLLNGEFTLQIKDAKTLKIREEIVAKNVITSRFISEADAVNANNFTGILLPFLGSLNISFSQENVPSGLKSVTGFGRFIATAQTDTTNLGAKITYADSDNDGVFDTLEIRQRLLFTGSLYASNIAYDRTFRSVALTNLTPAVDHTTVSGSPTYPNGTQLSSVWAYVNLGGDYTQKSNEIIDAIYRLRLPLSAQGYKTSKDFLHEIIYAVNNDNGDYNYTSTGRVVRSLFNYTNYCRFPASGWRYFNVYSESRITSTKFAADAHITLKNAKGAARYDAIYNSPSSSNDHTIGAYYSGVCLGRNNESLQTFLGRKIQTSGVATGHILNPHQTLNYSSQNTPFQDVFSHSPTAILPFQDNNNLARGSGKPTLSGTWEDQYPYMYRVQILDDGALGVAKYIWQRRRVTRFLGNTFNFEPLFNPFTHYNSSNPNLNKPFATYHAGVGEKTHDLGYSKTQIVRYNSTGITLLNLVNGNYQSWDLSTTPALPVLNLRHVDVDRSSGKIYAACEETGLWEISNNGATVTNLVNIRCRSVSVGFQGVVYALFWDGTNFSLRNSNNWNVTIPEFSFPLNNLNASNNECLWYITTDRSALNRVGLIGTHTNGSSRVWWWSLAGGLVNGPVQTITGITATNSLTFVESSPKGLVSSQQGFWYAMRRVTSAMTNNGVFYTFGSAVSTNIDTEGERSRFIGNGATLDENGYLMASRYLKNGNITLVDSANHIDDNGNAGASAPSAICSCCYLDKNLLFVSRTNGSGDYVLCYVTGNRITSGLLSSAINILADRLHPTVWENFSWNGTNWVSADPTWNGTAWVYPAIVGKTTHTTNDLLIEGISIKFEELSNLGFKAGDWYTQVVCLGVLKSNVNNLRLTSSAYLMPTELITAEETHTIKASPPHNVVVRKSSRGGSVPEVTFRWLDAETVPPTINIAGYPAPATIRIDNEISPALNEVLVNSSNGSLICNPADAGKQLTISEYLIVKGDQNRIIATPTPFAGIHNPIILLRHDVGITTDVNNNVTQWNDQSGYNNHVIPAPNQLPTRDSTTLLGGLPTVRFDTGYRRLVLPSSNPVDFSQGITFVARVFRLNGSRSRQVIFEMRNESISSNSHVAFGFRSENFWFFHSPITGSQSEETVTDGVYNSWRLYLATFNPDTNKLILRINGQTVLSKVILGNFGRFFGAARPQVIGASSNESNNWTLTGNLGFFAAYNHYLTIKECEVLENAILAIV